MEVLNLLQIYCKNIKYFYNEKITLKSFSVKNLNKIFYYHGKQAVRDILSHRLFSLKKIDRKLLNLINTFESKILPTMPINAKILMEKYHIPEGVALGNKLKMIEEKWVSNDFNLSEKEINEVISN